jgi:hypothetical protein
VPPRDAAIKSASFNYFDGRYFQRHDAEPADQGKYNPRGGLRIAYFAAAGSMRAVFQC